MKYIFENNLKIYTLSYIYQMIELILILETIDDKEHHIFPSSDSLEDYLATINLCDYCYSNILFRIDNELNYELTQLYNKRFLKKK